MQIKNLLFGLLIAAVGLVAGYTVDVTPARADHNVWLPALPTVTQLRVLERGYGLYCLDVNASNYPNFRTQLQQVYEAERMAVGIAWYESDNECDIIHQMVTGFPCGAGAAACVTYANDPVTVIYHMSLGYFNWMSTQAHEHGHWDGQHERYTDSGGQFSCDPNARYTRMSCGTAIWRPTLWDVAVTWNVLVPDKPLNVWLEASANWATVRWDNYRADCAGQADLGKVSTNPFGPAHFSCKNDVATRMAFGWAPYLGAPVIWAGEFCGSAYGFCYTDFQTYSRGFDSFWKGCLFVRAENEALWWVPQVSAPEYWSLAGCWQ